jgi:hypothetical protein
MNFGEQLSKQTLPLQQQQQQQLNICYRPLSFVKQIKLKRNEG